MGGFRWLKMRKPAGEARNARNAMVFNQVHVIDA
jgi:hypothetical protein